MCVFLNLYLFVCFVFGCAGPWLLCKLVSSRGARASRWGGSSVAQRGLQSPQASTVQRRLHGCESGSRAWAQELRHLGLAALQHVKSSQTRD